jgi:hypothetical protein
MMMKQQKWILGPAILALAIGTTLTSIAQPAGRTETPKVGRQGKRNRAGRAQGNVRAARATMVPSPQVLEKVLGKPLTDEQQKAVADAAQVYLENVAKVVGLTPDELKAQVQEYRAAQREARRQGSGPAVRAGGKGGATSQPGRNEQQ